MEKRNSKRIPVSLEAQLVWGDKARKAIVSDISKNGLYVIAVSGEKDFPDRAEKTLTVKFHLSSKEFLELSCKQIWSDVSPSSARKIGLEIKNPPVEFKEFYKKSYYRVKKEISHDPIAVIGMACYYPGASDLKSFWENILTRRREFRRIPMQRLPVSDYFDPDPLAQDKTYANKAAVIDGFEFDWVKRGIPKRVVESSDIVHWLSLEVALRALEDSGYSREDLPSDRTGVILGNTLTGEYSRSQNMRLRWPYVEKVLKLSASKKGLPEELVHELVGRMEKYYKHAFAPVTEDTLAGNLSNTIAGRICNFLDLHGGGYTVDGACSSSLIAIATAARDLSNSTLDLAIVGGVDVSLDTFELIGFAKTNALTKDEMRVYDRRANGFIPGEGAGFVILKRLEDARADGNYIYAVLRGWGISSDGKGGITAPKAQTQTLAIKRAYGKAGYSLSEVDFIEGHGTGTIVGDKAELEGIASALGDSDESPPVRSCGITSLKSLIGHTKAASGIGGFIKAVLSVNRRIIPPVAGCEEPSTVFQEKARGIYPIMQGEIRNAGESIRAGISGMGFGGINCHVTIESADTPARHLEPSIGERELLASYQKTEVFALSAESKTRMMELLDQVKALAKGISMAEMADLSRYLAVNTSPAKPFRVSLIANSPESLMDSFDKTELLLKENEIPEGKLMTSLQRDVWIGNSIKNKRVGFLFPGQGSQQLNMSRFLVERYKWARDFISRMESVLEKNGYERITEFVYRPVDRALDEKQLEDWKKTLSRSEIAQPAICMASLLWARHLANLGIRPAVAGGHSLGELTAFQVAGAFSEETLVHFAAFRGKLASAPDKGSGAMASFACGREQTKEILKGINGYVVIANVNSPVQTVISGEKSAVEKAVQAGKLTGIRIKYLPVSNAFHSKFMSEAAERIRSEAPIPEILNKTEIKLLTSMNGEEVLPGTDLRAHFSSQISSQIDFTALVNNLRGNCDILVEVGPGRVLSELANAIAGKAICLPVETRAGDDRALNTFLGSCFANGIEINWPALFENRLTRPFVPASKRIFIENPCERPLPDEMPDSQLKENSESRVRLRKPIIEKTFISSDPVPVKVAEGNQPFTAEGRGPEPLIKLASEMTGFPASSITLSNRLLDDLNLDSIKAGQFVAKALKLYGAEGQIDPTSMPNSSLIEIFQKIDRKVPERQGQIISEQEQGHEPKTIPGKKVENWVRDFRISYQELPRAESALKEKTLIKDLKKNKASFLLVSDKGAPCSEMENILLREGIRTASIPYKDLGSSQIDYDYIIFFLPKEKDPALLSMEQVHKMSLRMHAIAGLINSNKSRASRPVYALVQFGSGDFYKSGKNVSFEAKGATAFLCSIYLENPGERIKIMELSEKINAEMALKTVIEELRSGENFSMATFDAHLTRRVPVLELVETKKFPDRKINWTKKDVVLVTGGARGITAECALAFAEKTGIKLALIGTTVLIEKDKEIQAVLERYRGKGIIYRYYACDISEKECVSDLKKRIEQDLGIITGIMHGAAINRPRRAESVQHEEAIREVGPKLFGAMNLCEVLKHNPLKMFIGFGSVIGITGMAGNAWYGFSNEVLNLLLHKFRDQNKDTEVISFAFSIWDEVGMGKKMGGVDFLSGMGISPIPKEDGVAHFTRLLEKNPGPQQIIVSGRLGGLNTFPRRPVPELHHGRFLEEILFYEKGVEIKVRAVLSHSTDQYLQDHLFRGTYLFPAVFGIEAMAEAVSAVTGINPVDLVTLEDVRLAYPISIDPDGETEIHIHAIVQEANEGSDEVRVRSAITVDQTAFSKNHFEAVFVLKKQENLRKYTGKIPRKFLDIDPSEDLYGHILFQGRSFQRMKKIRALSGRQAVFDSAAEPKADLITGDPFFRDTLLQSVQLALPELIALPVEIGSWEIGLKYQKPGIHNVVMNITEKNENEITADVTVIDSQKRTIEKLSGYKAKIIQKLANAPQIPDLIAPEKWDGSRINVAIQRYCTRLNLIAPLVGIKYESSLHRMKKADRHNIEEKLFQKSYKKLMDGWKGIPEKAGLQWKKDGKPVVRGSDKISVSFSHDERALLCSLGGMEQGCDIEIIRNRSKEEWIELLGKNRGVLLKEVAALDNSVDRAGTRIWCAIEALRKASGRRECNLRHFRQVEDAILFEDGHLSALTFPVRLLRGPERVIAIVPGKGPLNEKTKAERPYGTVPEPDEGMFTGAGPEGQRVFSYKFPVVLKESSGIAGGLYFANYFHWLGHVRELALKPVRELISDEVLKGRFMVTNYSETRISGKIRNENMVEAQTWIEDISGPGNSTLVLHFEWRKLLPDGGAMPAASSEQQVSWKRSSEGGIIKSESCPDFFMEFLHQNGFIPKKRNSRAPDEKKIISAELGKSIFSNDIIRKEHILEERVFETTIEHSSLAGNIYFANFFRWQGQLRDRYLFKLSPEQYRKMGERGQFACLYSKVHHLHEAKPFDFISVTMKLKRLYECGMDLYFEYFNKGKENVKLAYGTHTLAWVLVNRAGNYIPQRIPQFYLHRILEMHGLSG